MAVDMRLPPVVWAAIDLLAAELEKYCDVMLRTCDIMNGEADPLIDELMDVEDLRVKRDAAMKLRQACRQLFRVPDEWNCLELIVRGSHEPA